MKKELFDKNKVIEDLTNRINALEERFEINETVNLETISEKAVLEDESPELLQTSEQESQIIEKESQIICTECDFETASDQGLKIHQAKNMPNHFSAKFVTLKLKHWKFLKFMWLLVKSTNAVHVNTNPEGQVKSKHTCQSNMDRVIIFWITWKWTEQNQMKCAIPFIFWILFSVVIVGEGSR